MTIQPVANFDQVAIYYCQQRQHLEILLSSLSSLYWQNYYYHDFGIMITIMILRSRSSRSRSWSWQLPPDRVAALVRAGKEWDECAAAGWKSSSSFFFIVMLSWLLSRSLEFYLHHHHRDFFIAFTLNSTGRYNPLIYGNDVDSVDIATRVAMVGTSWLMSLILMMTMTMMMMMLTMMMTIPRCVSSTPPTYLPTSQSTLARFAFTQGCHHDLGIMIQIICTIWSSSWSL